MNKIIFIKKERFKVDLLNDVPLVGAEEPDEEDACRYPEADVPPGVHDGVVGPQGYTHSAEWGHVQQAVSDLHCRMRFEND